MPEDSEKEIEEEREAISQSVRNWRGGDLVFRNIIERLENLKALIDNTKEHGQNS
mgnify:CR=1 FL=1